MNTILTELIQKALSELVQRLDIDLLPMIKDIPKVENPFDIVFQQIREKDFVIKFLGVVCKNFI